MTDAEERKNLINITNFILHSKLLLLIFILGLNRPNKRVGSHNVILLNIEVQKGKRISPTRTHMHGHMKIMYASYGTKSMVLKNHL
jgi:hypothetical protein